MISFSLIFVFEFILFDYESMHACLFVITGYDGVTLFSLALSVLPSYGVKKVPQVVIQAILISRKQNNVLFVDVVIVVC